MGLPHPLPGDRALGEDVAPRAGDRAPRRAHAPGRPLTARRRPVAYLVAAHHRPDLVAALVDALAPSRVLIHLDAKADDRAFREALIGRAHAELVSDRVVVRWAGWSQVEAALCLMRAVSPVLGDDEAAVLLSGDSFPLQSPASIARFLAGRPARQYMTCVGLPVPDAGRLATREFGSMTRLSRLRLEADPAGRALTLARVINRLELRRPYRAALGGRTPYGGSQWWTLTGAAIRWLLGASDEGARLRRLARTSSVPDEFYLPTLLMSSPFASEVRPSLMFTDWSGGSSWSPAPLDGRHVDAFAANGLVARAVRGVDFLDRHEVVGRDLDGGTPVLFARKLVDTTTADRIRDQLWPQDLVGLDRGR